MWISKTEIKDGEEVVECYRCGALILERTSSKVKFTGFSGTFIEYYCPAHKPRYSECVMFGTNPVYYSDHVEVEADGTPVGYIKKPYQSKK